MRRPALAVLALALGVLVSGCGFRVSGPRQPIPPGRTCEGVPEPLCSQQLASAEGYLGRQHAPIEAVLVRCTGQCTGAGGEGETIIHLADGTEVTGGWAVAGPLLPAPPEPEPSLPVEPVCAGVEPERCREFAIGAVQNARPTAIVSIVVRCSGTCTLTKGEGTTVVTYADGSKDETSWGYEGEAP